MDKDKVHIFLLTSGKPRVCLFMLFLLVASKKSKFLKSITCLGKAIPCTFYILFFPFYKSTYFLCKLDCMSHLLFLYQLYFLYFFYFFYLCKQSTCMMSLASTLASTGDYFFYFFAKKYKKQQKSMISKHK